MSKMKFRLSDDEWHETQRIQPASCAPVSARSATVQRNTSRFPSIPNEVLENVGQYLSVPDLAAVSQCSKRYSGVFGSTQCWMPHVRRRFIADVALSRVRTVPLPDDAKQLLRALMIESETADGLVNLACDRYNDDLQDSAFDIWRQVGNRYLHTSAGQYAMGTLERLVHNRMSKAQEYYEIALKLNPNHVNTLCDSAAPHAVSDAPRAMEYYRRALAINPNHFATLYNFTSLLHRQGQYIEEFFLTARLLSISPLDTRIWMRTRVAINLVCNGGNASPQTQQTLRQQLPLLNELCLTATTILIDIEQEQADAEESFVDGVPNDPAERIEYFKRRKRTLLHPTIEKLRTVVRTLFAQQGFDLPDTY